MNWGPDAIATLAALIHKLAGSSGAYGFQEIHAKALEANTRLKTLSTLEPEPSTERRIAEIRENIDQLVSALKSNAL